MAMPMADRVPVRRSLKENTLSRKGRAGGRATVLARGQLLLEGGLIVIELEVGQVGQVNGEIEREIAVWVPHEVEPRAPLMQLPLQPDHLRLEFGVRDVVLRGPGEGPERRGRKVGTEAEVLLAERAIESQHRQGPVQGVIE